MGRWEPNARERLAKAALELYEQLLTSQPNSPKLWNERGVTLHQDGRFEDAEESYRKALAADPQVLQRMSGSR